MLARSLARSLSRAPRPLVPLRHASRAMCTSEDGVAVDMQSVSLSDLISCAPVSGRPSVLSLTPAFSLFLPASTLSELLCPQVKDDPGAHQMDLVFDRFIDEASMVEGVTGAARMVCKSEWDYNLILKFEDIDSLKSYMADHHDKIWGEFESEVKALAVGNIKQQNFVYDDIE
eukprot:scaffold91620_cov23-Tisochrysis_lutea.AAC.1